MYNIFDSKEMELVMELIKRIKKILKEFETAYNLYKENNRRFTSMFKLLIGLTGSKYKDWDCKIGYAGGYTSGFT